MHDSNFYFISTFIEQMMNRMELNLIEVTVKIFITL